MENGNAENGRSSLARLAPVLAEIGRRLRAEEEKSVIVAIDGRCASGKTTLASVLADEYDCNVFHMDDFFLRPEQRTKERLSAPGENVDHERFLAEVLLPLSENREVTFRRFSCHDLRLEAPQTLPIKRLNIVEGTYSLHPSLIGYYDLTVFSDISPEEQRERIRNRNTPESAERFFSVWIPLEEKYFNGLAVREKADLIL